MDYDYVANRCEEIERTSGNADVMNLARYVRELVAEVKRLDQELWELRQRAQ